MMSDSWDMECNRQNFLSFWTVFLPFYPSNNPKNQKFEKMKKLPGRYHFIRVYHKWQSYDVWFLRYEARRTECFVILDHFLPFYPPNNQKNQNFEKTNKPPRDIIILHMCTINDNHMMYRSWDMECDRQNFLSSWTVFCPFTALTTWKIKILQKWKKHLEILTFYTSVSQMTIIWCMVPEIWSVTDVIFILGYFLPCYLTARKTKI